MVGTLPFECIELILNTFEEDQNGRSSHHTRCRPQFHLLQICRVSRTWNAVATPLLYSRIKLSSVLALKQLMNTLKSNEHLRRLVHSVDYSRCRRNRWNSRFTFSETYYLVTIHSLCPKMQAMVIAERNPGTWAVAEAAFQKGVEQSIPLNLTHLVLGLGQRDPHAFLNMNLSLPRLRDLVVMDLCVYPPPYSQGLCWPDMPSLHRLTLLNHGHFHDLPFPITSKNLSVLEIIGGVYHTDHFWGNLLPFSTQLESFTLVPIYLSCIPPNNSLAFLSSLSDLRISLGCFYPSMVENIHVSPPTLDLPSSLYQLTLTNEPYRCRSRHAVMRSVRDQIERVLLERRIMACYENLARICVAVMVDRRHRLDMGDIEALASVVGVELDVRLRRE